MYKEPNAGCAVYDFCPTYALSKFVLYLLSIIPQSMSLTHLISSSICQPKGCMKSFEYSGRQNASVRTCGKQRSGGQKAPLEQLNCNAYPVGFPVKALPRQRCLQPLLERLQDIGFKKAASTSPEWCFPYPDDSWDIRTAFLNYPDKVLVTPGQDS